MKICLPIYSLYEFLFVLFFVLCIISDELKNGSTEIRPIFEVLLDNQGITEQTPCSFIANRKRIA